MRLLLASTTILAVFLGGYVGYGTAGVGGAILYGAMIGAGGAIFGSLLGRTALLLRRSWNVVVATAALVFLAVLFWGVYF